MNIVVMFNVPFEWLLYFESHAFFSKKKIKTVYGSTIYIYATSENV